MSDAPALAISDLRFRYGDAGSVWTVDVGSFELPRGEQMLLTAGSGRGKSTLLYLIAGLLEPASGSIRVAGRDMTKLHGAARDQYRGRHIGMIFQTFNLLVGFTALENVMMPMMFSTIPPKEHRERARALLARLGIERADVAPEALSVGQQQRVAVARAVACDPVLVLADEPTASLDPENADVAMELIQQACREGGAALLCTSHDPAMRSRFERQTTLEGLAAGVSAAAQAGRGG